MGTDSTSRLHGIPSEASAQVQRYERVNQGEIEPAEDTSPNGQLSGLK
jgi:hypothetical protein